LIIDVYLLKINKMSFNNVIIFDGIKEYKNAEVFSDPKLRAVFNVASIMSMLITKSREVNAVDGYIYIAADEQHTMSKYIELKNSDGSEFV
jgi:hypothetical protein